MLIYDIETNGLLTRVEQRGKVIPAMTKVHCIVIYDTETQEYELYDPDNMPVEMGVRRLLKAGDETCGHNIIGFDEHALKLAYPTLYEIPKNSVDTLVLARLLNPTVKQGDFARAKKGMLPGKLIGAHSLESYGYRLGEYKGEYGKDQDWQTWEPEMTSYCRQDVRVTVELYKRLQARPGFGTIACWIEMMFARFIDTQMRIGVYFNRQVHDDLIATLKADLKVEQEIIDKSCPPFYKQKGTGLFYPKRDNKAKGYVADAPVTKIELVPFNPNANNHIYTFLIKKYGWEPEAYTEKSNEPKIDDKILAKLSEIYPECGPLGRYKLIKKRLSQVHSGNKGWSKYITANSRIHGYVNSCGAVSQRCTHSNPNLGQVPANDKPYGKRCRSCFGATPGRVFVGCDAAGLELRLLAHFMNDPVYIDLVLNGDAHQHNADILGIIRDAAKTWFYGMIYGAGAELLGKGDKKFGMMLKRKFLKEMPAFKALQDEITDQVKRDGYLVGIAGQRLYSRSPHSALNLKLQSAGAYIMKYAAVLVWERMDFTRCSPVLNVHDEFQFESDPDYAEECGQILRQAIIDAGTYFKLNIRMDAAYKVGATWKDTH